MKNCLSDDFIDEKFVSPYKKFLLMPGLGHVEMNERKTFAKIALVSNHFTYFNVLRFSNTMSKRCC